MVFNSFVFVGFFLLVYALYRVPSHRWQNRMLLVASYIFYGWWDWRFLGLILLSTLVDFQVGQSLSRTDDSRKRRRLLVISLAINLGTLVVFKYANFFADSLQQALSPFGLQLDIHLAQIVLPVGISFYTFQTLSYTIDVYRKELQPTRDFFDFALFVAYFPQLVAGPIERARVLLPQIETPRTTTRSQLEEGAWLILSGYYLKCVLADNLAPFAERVFSSPDSVHGLEIIVGIWAAAFQIYGDFAGYSRIAIGVSKLLGIDLMQNFNRPYLATSPSDFWRRWHISLSTWLRDYLYIPLGGNRGGIRRTYFNLLLTMILGGLWHGAARNFVAWGAFHGLILCVWRIADSRSTQRVMSQPHTTTRLLNAMLFFQLTCVGWLLFFLKDLSDLSVLAVNLLQGWTVNGRVGLMTLVCFAAPVMALEIAGELTRSAHAVFRWRRTSRLLLYSVTAFAIAFCGVSESTEFIYFQF